VIDWDSIVREHDRSVFGTAWRILGHVADAEDVAQEVFLEAYQWPLTRPVRSWGGLLRRLSACRALDRLRQRKNHVPLDGLALMTGSAGPEEEAVGNELAARLRAKLALLPPREGTVFCLRYFEDLSYQDIADMLTITPGAVAAALCKARAKLESYLLEPEARETPGEPADPLDPFPSNGSDGRMRARPAEPRGVLPAHD
jgi:RNA polymerase sigma-70 factor (ECF subfamily)